MKVIEYVLDSLAILYLEEIEEILEHLEREKRRRRPITHGRFGGFRFHNSEGNLVMATQQLTVGTPATCALVFLAADGVTTGKGPVGTVSSSDGSVSAGLSEDGQSCNALMTLANVTSTLTWHDPAGVVPDFSVDVSDVVAPPEFVAASGSFGTFADGTTT